MWDERQKNILKLLLNHFEGIRGATLSNHLQVSARTIRSDIAKINLLLKPYNCKIFSDNKKGYFILGENTPLITQLLADNSSDRRLKILGILFFSHTIHLDEMEDILFYSSSTIYKEVVQLQNSIVKKMNDCFFHLSGNTIVMEENELKIRKCFLNFLQEENLKNTYFSDRNIEALFYLYLDTKERDKIKQLLRHCFTEENIVLSDEVLFLIHWSIAFFSVRNRQGYLLPTQPPFQKGDKSITDVLTKVISKTPFLTENDLYFLDDFMWSFRILQPDSEINQTTENAIVIEEFLTEVFQKYELNLRATGEMLQNLKLHIVYMLRRLQSGYGFENPLKNNVKEQYPLAYEISMLIVPIVYRYKHQYLLEGEISYIAVYIQYCIEEMFNTLNVVVVSRSNSVLLKLIKDWLVKNFYYKMTILTAMNLGELDRYLKTEPVDFIIFTTNPTKEYATPIYVLQDLPTPTDKINMIHLLNDMHFSAAGHQKTLKTIKSTLSSNLFQIFSQAISFEDALMEMCCTLEQTGNISSSRVFYNDLIYRESIYPTFLSVNLMAPHPLQSYAASTGVFVGLFPNGVKCGKNDVKAIFILALEPKLDKNINELFKMLQKISNRKSNIDTLSKSQDFSDFLNIFKSLCKKTNTIEKENDFMKILVLCNAGMSSSILMKKIQEVADKQNKEITISAKSTADIEEEKGKWDVCLVAPQIMYAAENIKNTLNIPTLVIDFRDYAVANGENVLTKAIALLESNM